MRKSYPYTLTIALVSEDSDGDGRPATLINMSQRVASPAAAMDFIDRVRATLQTASPPDVNALTKDAVKKH